MENKSQAVVVHTFNLSTWEAGQAEFETRLVYKSESGQPGLQRKPVSKKKKKKELCIPVSWSLPCSSERTGRHLLKFQNL
jgi:hypothetical protein